MKYVIVLPYAYGPYAIDCFETFDVKLTENCVAVDNTGAGGHENFGVAGSWNIGIDRLREIDGDWLIVMSAAIRFGEAGGLDMIQQIESHPLAKIIHFGTIDVEEQGFYRGKGPGYPQNLGWHLTAIR